MSLSGHNPSPTTDLVFRKLFGSDENKDLLISLINSVVSPKIVVTDVVIKNPFNLAEYVGSKQSIVDIKAQDQNGTWYAIEMQVHGHVLYGKRAIYYAAKSYVDQQEEGQSYTSLNATIGIHFLGFDMFNDARVMRHFAFRDTETNQASDDLNYLAIYFVELGKFHKALPEISTDSDRWLAFLTMGENLDGARLPASLGVEPKIIKAVTTLERMGTDPVLRDIYEAEEKAKMVDVAELQYAKEKGLEQGMQLGQVHLLHRMLTKRFGVVPETVASAIDALTPAQVDELGEALFDLNSWADVEAWLAQLAA